MKPPLQPCKQLPQQQQLQGQGHLLLLLQMGASRGWEGCFGRELFLWVDGIVMHLQGG